MRTSPEPASTIPRAADAAAERGAAGGEVQGGDDGGTRDVAEVQHAVGVELAGIVRGEPAHWHWQWHSLLPLSYLVLAASCIGHSAFSWLAPRTTPVTLSTYAYMNPLVATVLGWLILGEVLSSAQQLGSLLVISGVALTNWAARRG